MSNYGWMLNICMTFLESFVGIYIFIIIFGKQKKDIKQVCLFAGIGITVIVTISEMSTTFLVTGGVVLIGLFVMYIILQIRERDRSVFFNNESKGLSIAILLSVIALAMVIFVFGAYSKKASLDTIGIILAIALFLIIVLYAVILFYFENNRKSLEFDIMREQVRETEILLDEQKKAFFLWRTSIHDYKNTMAALYAMAENGEFEKLTAYLKGKCESHEMTDDGVHSGNTTVDAILNMKRLIAKDRRIPFDVKAKMPAESSLPMVSLAVILGNLLDNALDASNKEQAPYIDVVIEEQGNMIFIKILNACTNYSKDTDTSKPDAQYHGLGLKSVQKHIRNLGGEFRFHYENAEVSAEVMLPFTSQSGSRK